MGQNNKRAVLLTGVGKRYDIVASFAQHTTTIACDPNPLAPAQYAATERFSVPRFDDPEYIPALVSLCEQFDVGAVVPLTDLDIEVLGEARQQGLLPAFVSEPSLAAITFDKYKTHRLLEKLGFPSPPTVLPGSGDFPVPAVVKPRRGSGSRSIHPAHSAEEVEFFCNYVKEPVIIQRLMGGPEVSIDLLCDMEGRCLNAIPRAMLESRGGESIQGGAIYDERLIHLAKSVGETLGVRGQCMIQVFEDPEIGFGITDINTRFGGGFPAHMYAAKPGQTYPELIIKMANGEPVEPHVGDFTAGNYFTRYYWQLELDHNMKPTGRDIVAGGPPPPRP